VEEQTTTLPHDMLRDIFQWGTYGKSGNEPLRYIYLKDISDNHLVNIIAHLCSQVGNDNTLRLMQNERAYRTINGISVSDYLCDFKFLAQ
jgi:hypothetical protein